MHPLQGAQIRSLVRELRSLMPHSVTNKEKKNDKEFIWQVVLQDRDWIRVTAWRRHWDWAVNIKTTTTTTTKTTTSLVVQCIRLSLPIQGIWVPSQVLLEDFTCHGATKPMCHNYGGPHAYSLCSTTREATAMRNPCTLMKTQCNQKKKKKPRTKQKQ